MRQRLIEINRYGDGEDSLVSGHTLCWHQAVFLESWTDRVVGHHAEMRRRHHRCILGPWLQTVSATLHARTVSGSMWPSQLHNTHEAGRLFAAAASMRVVSPTP